jgi:hypothetical protein
MTVTELNKTIGKTVMFSAGALSFTCYVKDAKIGYGQPRFLIQPVAGSGERWVEVSSLVPNLKDMYRPSEKNQVGLVKRI